MNSECLKITQKCRTLLIWILTLLCSFCSLRLIFVGAWDLYLLFSNNVFTLSLLQKPSSRKLFCRTFQFYVLPYNTAPQYIRKISLVFFSLLKAKGTPAMKNVQKIAGNGRKMVILWCCYVSLDYQKKKHKILHYQGNVFSTYIQGYNRILVDFTFFLQCTFMSDFGT